MLQRKWRKDVSGGRRRTRLEGNGGQTCRTLPRSYMRKRLINTNWIRQQHPQRAVAVGKLGEEAPSQGEVGLDRKLGWTHSPTIQAVGEETLVSTTE